MNAVCTFLEWDSAFFGSRIARVTEPTLSLTQAQALEAWCQQQGIDCLYWLIDAGDLDSIRIAEQHRFQLMDLRVTLRLTVPPKSDEWDEALHLASAADLEALQAIARTAHTDSRFFADPHFPRERCEELYAVWLLRDMQEGTLWVADVEGQPCGYITCRIRADGLGQIGLLGVDARAQGRGIGARLVRQSIRWFRDQGIDTMSSSRRERMYALSALINTRASSPIRCRFGIIVGFLNLDVPGRGGLLVPLGDLSSGMFSDKGLALKDLRIESYANCCAVRHSARLPSS